jgi:hypothetical protein
LTYAHCCTHVVLKKDLLDGHRVWLELIDETFHLLVNLAKSIR